LQSTLPKYLLSGLESGPAPRLWSARLRETTVVILEQVAAPHDKVGLVRGAEPPAAPEHP
jgi:hypothetical protein